MQTFCISFGSPKYEDQELHSITRLSQQLKELFCVGKWTRGQAELYFRHWLHTTFKHLLNSAGFGDFSST